MMVTQGPRGEAEKWEGEWLGLLKEGDRKWRGPDEQQGWERRQIRR